MDLREATAIKATPTDSSALLPDLTFHSYCLCRVQGIGALLPSRYTYVPPFNNGMPVRYQAALILCSIMKEDHPGVSGLQDPVLQQNRSLAVPNFDFVQIWHVYSN